MVFQTNPQINLLADRLRNKTMTDTQNHSSLQSSEKIKVAAIQMQADLGNVENNLARAESLVREAIRSNAKWIVLPEFFTSAVAFNRCLLDAICPLDGAPMKLLQRLAREGDAIVGGSYLALRGGHAYNTFVLAFPDGTTYLHDKDQPTMWENCYYVGGGDDGVLTTPAGRVGVALCWEFIRSRTPMRLQEKVDLIVGGSCWWTGPEEAIAVNPEPHLENVALLHRTPSRIAKMLGVPVIHASHAGKCDGFSPPDETRPFHSHFLGETQITDGSGNILECMTHEDGEGIITADIEMGKVQGEQEEIPDSFWIPQLPEISLRLWEEQNSFGREYYQSTTLPFLAERFEQVVPA